MKFGSRICVLVPLVVALFGCSVQSDPLDPDPSVAAVPQIAVSSGVLTTPDEWDGLAAGEGDPDALALENAEKAALDYWEELSIWDTEVSSTKQKDIHGAQLCVEFDSETGHSVISVNGQRLIRWTDSLYGGGCCLSGKLIDQNGTQQLVLFIWPATSNVAAGDVHVFRIHDDGVEDILAISGRKTNVDSEGRSDDSFPMPDNFDYSASQHAQSGLNDWCFGVTIIEYEHVYYLRILHSNQEGAYTYLAQHGERWDVLQQIILPD